MPENSFTQMGLANELLKSLADLNYQKATPIQDKAIPAILNGQDVMAAAQTGTGKTAGFSLPLLQTLAKGQPAKANQARALILTPTRELAAQVHQSIINYGKYLSLKSCVVYGGVKINPQMMKLRKGVDVLVATPGRLLDLYHQNAVRFDNLEMFILDEADRMLDMGFIPDIKKIINLLPNKRQNLLFSATFSKEIRQLAKTLVKDPVEISVDPKNSTVKTVTHWIHPVDKKQKSAALYQLITENQWFQLLVFTKTKRGANRLCQFLEKKQLKASAIHGNKSQSARTRALSDFKKGDIQILVATDIAARGLDISQLPVVVNFDLPTVAEDYVHRIGRTGRAGQKGLAISLVCADELKQLSAIENLIKKLLTRKYIDGFEPVHELPESKLHSKAKKPKKPKKPKSPKTEHRDGQRPVGSAKKNPKSKYSKSPYSKSKSSKSKSSQSKHSKTKSQHSKKQQQRNSKPA